MSMTIDCISGDRTPEAGKCRAGRAEASGVHCRQGNVFLHTLLNDRLTSHLRDVVWFRPYGNRQPPRQRPPTHIRLLSHIPSAPRKYVLRMGLACSGARVPKMAEDCICVPEPFGFTTSLHTHDACEEDPGYLAALADLRGNTGSSAPPSRARRR